MKLSVWQQFSSNHSASFTIVAVFETPEQTIKAKEQLEDIFKRITDWYDEDEQRWVYIYELSPVEKELAAQYHVRWNSAMAWFHNAIFAIQDNVLAISTDGQADSGAQPVDMLLKKFGAKVAVDGERIRYEELRFGILKIVCIAPNRDTAEMIIKMYKGNYKPKRQGEPVLLKLNAIHFDFPTRLSDKPKWFEVFTFLKAQGCDNFQVRVSDTKLGDWDDYDMLHQQLK